MYKYQGFLIGKKYVYKVYIPQRIGDHEHCNMCGEEFSGIENPPKWGYGAIDGIGWLCRECFNEYKEEYRWTSC